MANGPSTSHRRMRFPEIGPQAYEHPTDRAALVALRKVKGFELVLRRMFGAVPERRLRLLYLANGVRVGPDQLPQLDRLLDEACEILDLAKKPELYVVGDPRVKAMAVGMDAPFVVVNSSLLQLMDPDELRCVIGHEVGHILELTRFRGSLITWERRVHDAEESCAVPAGAPAANGGAGAIWALPGFAGGGVRAVRPGDP